MWSVEKAKRFAAYRPSVCWQLMVILAFAVGTFIVLESSYLLPLADVSEGSAANGMHYAMIGYSGLLMFQFPVALIFSLTRTPVSVSSALKALLPGSLLAVVISLVLSLSW